jgi:hypothetical protein
MKTCYTNKSGEKYDGEKPDDMSDDEFEKMMAKKGYMKKSEDGDEDEAPAAEAESEDEEEDVEKSEVSVETLDEVLGQLETMAKAVNPHSEKEDLLSKAQAGTITAEENEQLVAILSGKVPTLSDAAISGLESDSMQKAIEVSDYLEAHNEGVKFGLSYLASELEKSHSAAGEFNSLLAKSVIALAQDLGQKIEALSSTLEAWGEKEVVQVKKPITAKAIEKSLSGEEPKEVMPWREAIATLGTMFEESIEKSMHGRSEKGTQLNEAIAFVNRTHQVPNQLASEIKQFQASRGKAS